jgi:ABC-type multidrug transport system fused ATPase/permease subunit
MNIPLKQYWNLLLNYLKPQWLLALLLTVLLFGNIGLQLVNPQLMRFFIDSAQGGEHTGTLLRAALLFTGVALIQQIVSVLATYVSENVGWTATNALRADLAGHCLDLNMSFHNAHTPGEMIERIDGDVTALANFFSQFVIQVLGNGLLLLGVLILLFREDWRVGAALTGFSTLTLLVLARLRGIAVPHWKAERQASADLFGFLEERLSGTEDIRSNGAQAYVMRRFFHLMRELMQRSLKAALMVNIMLNSSILLFTLGNAVAFAVGALLFQANALTIGTVYIIFHYTNMLERPIRQITHQMQDLQKAGAGITRIQELFSTESRIQDLATVAPRGSGLPRGALAVRFQDVTFGYDDGVSSANNGSDRVAGPGIVLRDLSFHLKPGSVLGLLGRTGGGKTTLTRLLFRLYDPDCGAIFLGDGAAPCDIRHIPLIDLRQRVGMVTQDIQLFHATVRENLTLFDDTVPDERLLQVIEELGLWEWYATLADGLDTELESEGGGLSAGEAQLLAFTRIFLQDPGLVILDEASSRLDPATERLIVHAVDRLVQGRTAIIIAHRLETVQRADEIMILDRGSICEFGSRAKLASDPNSRFFALLQTGLEEVLA